MHPTVKVKALTKQSWISAQSLKPWWENPVTCKSGKLPMKVAPGVAKGPTKMGPISGITISEAHGYICCLHNFRNYRGTFLWPLQSAQLLLQGFRWPSLAWGPLRSPSKVSQALGSCRVSPSSSSSPSWLKQNVDVDAVGCWGENVSSRFSFSPCRDF